MPLALGQQEYKPLLSLYETQEAIGMIKSTFEQALSRALHLKRVSAPLFVETASGLNDDLSGVERPVRFEVKDDNTQLDVVHSLAKWKRLALKQYGFPVGEGLYTDMDAIRRDETMGPLHSIYVDQWDWEKVITEKQRTMATLKDAMQRIITAIGITNDMLKWRFPQLTTDIEREASFITSQELEDLYPNKTPKEREYLFTKEHRSACILQIGDKLSSGQPHDSRAPDYDDWALNGDILLWDETIQTAVEISSMGIRVSPESLKSQLEKSGCQYREKFPFHRALLQGELPYTIGGGIGQSRMCMVLLEKRHIGEVQSSYWSEAIRTACDESGIFLL